MYNECIKLDKKGGPRPVFPLCGKHRDGSDASYRVCSKCDSKALSEWKPEIVNSDQGSHFTVRSTRKILTRGDALNKLVLFECKGEMQYEKCYRFYG